jgi:hypothetical protein
MVQSAAVGILFCGLEGLNGRVFASLDVCFIDRPSRFIEFLITGCHVGGLGKDCCCYRN